jgi:hypothetical protein
VDMPSSRIWRGPDGSIRSFTFSLYTCAIQKKFYGKVNRIFQ